MGDFLPWLIGGAALVFIAAAVFWPGRTRGGMAAGVGHHVHHDADGTDGGSSGDAGGGDGGGGD